MGGEPQPGGVDGLRRPHGALLLLLVLSALIFLLLYLAPGDLARNLIGLRNVTPETIAAVRAQYRLDDPLWLQYLGWMGDALRGDLGTSARNQAPVAQLLASRAGVTLALALLGFGIAVTVAVPLGIVCARRAGGTLDRLITTGSVIGISAPSFAVALLLLATFSLALGWFPLYGIGDGGLDTLHHLVLPAVTVALGLGAIVVKLTRTAVVRELARDYVVAARARGFGERAVLRLALRNAVVPIVTGAGLVLTFLVGGTVFVETVFALPGWGTLLQDAVLFKDVAVVQALTLAIAALIVVIALLVDLACLALDPRLRPTRRTA